jgi:hypothetical protein
MTSTKYIGMDVHKESISIAVRNDAGKVVMECVIETKASMILQFIDGLHGDVHVTLEEGTWAAWLYDRLSWQRLPETCPKRDSFQRLPHAKRSKGKIAKITRSANVEEVLRASQFIS